MRPKTMLFLSLTILVFLGYATTAVSGNMINIRLSRNIPDHDTSIGKLKDSFLMMDGQMNLKEKPMVIEWGAIYMNDEEGYQIGGNNIKIYGEKETRRFNLKPNIPINDNKIIFIQDLVSKKWLANRGFLFLQIVMIISFLMRLKLS